MSLGQGAIDMLVLGIEGIEKIADRPLIKLSDAADLGAKLRLVKSRLDALEDKINGRVKSDLIASNKTIAEGDKFIGTLSVVTKTILNSEKVKAFLGKQLSKFLVERDEYRLSYKAKP